MAKKSEGSDSVTMTLDELGKLVDERVRKALKQQGVRHAKSPAPRVQVNHGRLATSGGYIESRPDAWWEQLREAVKRGDEAYVDGILDQLRAHRRQIASDLDPAAQKIDAFIQEFEPADVA